MMHDYAELLAVAEMAAARAYAPYSRFKVGAALLTRDHGIYEGCNVENASYPLTVCAERTAIGHAIAEGVNEGFEAIAIVQSGHNGEPCWPCGACRQVLAEFNPEMVVVLRNAGQIQTLPLRELLPYMFEPARLKG